MVKSFVHSLLRRLVGPRMLYGYRRADGTWLPHTRISTATELQCPQRLQIEDHVYIGHFNFIDAAGGLAIGEGTQITSHVSVLSHSSHVAARLMGRRYWGHPAPAGMRLAATSIGPYCFIGPGAVIAPGSRLGRGVLVRAHSYVDGEFPDYAIVGGQPARVLGDVREIDAPWLEQHPEAAEHYCGIGRQQARR
ncbi:acyltransferase [Caldimonas thermodepolymerans]|jgi:Acetyltransferase (isoleucine patch superfamily)|uniref:acyltransferase n=1 Tax=Caldimonas thermodepolymerans TaxID=215580 RepID=UPI00249388D3|nr:acyltransferase [Caldimonas thermodepolymerans]